MAVGDINNDGLVDIYFAGNQVGNKLYLNQGGFFFKDITESAGVACLGVWSTGVTFVDINADGLLDIYVCKSGDPDSPNRHNELFINNGNLTFTDKAKEYGLDVVGLSVHASFFDYDKDGDLDCYLLTNSFKSVGAFDLVKDQRKVPDPLGGGNKFFINDGSRFHDSSDKTGIYRSNIGFGLGITLGDFNEDNWTDIYVSNDFFERDYLYLNNQKGAFIESLTDYFESISMGSMGADYADLDNDGRAELFVTEMLPDSLHRRKTKTVFENWNKYVWNLQNGYHYQFSRNVLQKKTSGGSFVEIGRFAGVAASEWSWGALLFDMDNDGWRDIFVANGIYKDLLDRDYLTYSGSEENVKKIIRNEKNGILKLIDLMPSSLFPNLAFHNNRNLTFSNQSAAWGLGEPMFSSGSAYGDFDNDGDLDLVVNNTNEPSTLFRNNVDSARFKSVTISLSSDGFNTFSIGAKVIAYVGKRTFTADNFVTRGFQSSVSPMVHLGLGENVTTIDSVVVWWPTGGYSVAYNITPGNRLFLQKNKFYFHQRERSAITRPSADFTLERMPSSIFRHKNCGLVDFDRNRLIPMMYSNETPSLTKGDINNDGIDEVYVGGGKQQTGVFVQFNEGKLNGITSEAFNRYALSEETKGKFIDIDNDSDLDLYMASGGRFFPGQSSALSDRVFLNNGLGELTESTSSLPFSRFVSTSVVESIDYDNDGDVDLVVGERFDTFQYGRGGGAYLFENNGKGVFTDVTNTKAPLLREIGMITDIKSVDFDTDGLMDLILVGDWMSIKLLRNTQNQFVDFSGKVGVNNTNGWWHSVEFTDLNRDRKPDFVIANHGLNSFFKEGDRMYVNDFDSNGSTEQIFCTQINDKYYPIIDRDDLLSQIPSLKKRILYYSDYSKMSIGDLFSESVLRGSKVLDVQILSSVLLLSSPDGYDIIKLPKEAQYSPLYALLLDDIDNDGVIDLLAGGNQYLVKPQFGRYDASHGWFFKGVFSDGKFTFLPGLDLNVKGQIRDIETVSVNGVKFVLFAKHDDELEIYKVRM